jgi:hypothetical protein
MTLATPGPNPSEADKLKEAIHVALRAWHTLGGTADDLLDFLLMVRRQRMASNAGDNPSLLRKVTNSVLLQAIDDLALQEPDKARVLRLRFLDGNTIAQVSYMLDVSEDTVNRIQREAIQSLAKIIEAYETAARKELAQSMEAHLPPPTYTDLFGVDDYRMQVCGQLLRENSPWVIALVGIGGIGKTAIADAITRHVIRHFHYEQVIWLRYESPTMSGRSLAPQVTAESLIAELAHRLWPEAANSLSPEQRLVQVRQALKARPHLVVIDNLESQTDAAYLLAHHLNDLARPGKFLLTTRTRLAGQAAVRNVSVDELPFGDAEALMRRHARDTGVAVVAEASTADLQAIFDTVGGNPLALKLVVTLLDTIPLPRVLAELARGPQGKVEEMYRHIYWRTWQTLDQDARALLQAMPIVADVGATPEYLQEVSGLEEDRLWPAIQELRRRSLLEVRGNLHEKRYGIHRLTETFLRTEIIHWDET